MQIFATRMYLTKTNQQSGFTLLELMIVLLIVGVVLSYGASFLYSDTQKIEKAATKVLYTLSSIRTDAIISRSSRTIIFEGNKIVLQNRNEKKILETFDNDIYLHIVKAGTTSRGRESQAIFGSNGVCEEFLLLIQHNVQTISLYISPTGDNLVRNGTYSLEEMRQELLTDRYTFGVDVHNFA